MLGSYREPLRFTAPAQCCAQSLAFGELAVPKPTGMLAQYDAAFERSFAEFLTGREANREFGMLNFGDWWGEREINWGNSEYDTQHSFFLQYVRTGRLDYFRVGEQAELHNRDIDTVHDHQDPRLIGGVWAHSIGHTGEYYRASSRQKVSPTATLVTRRGTSTSTTAAKRDGI